MINISIIISIMTMSINNYLSGHCDAHILGQLLGHISARLARHILAHLLRHSLAHLAGYVGTLLTRHIVADRPANLAKGFRSNYLLNLSLIENRNYFLILKINKVQNIKNRARGTVLWSKPVGAHAVKNDAGAPYFWRIS